MMIFSALNSSSSHCCRAQLRSRDQLAGGPVVFLGDLTFCPTLRLTGLKMSEIILTGRKTQIEKKATMHYCM